MVPPHTGNCSVASPSYLVIFAEFFAEFCGGVLPVFVYFVLLIHSLCCVRVVVDVIGAILLLLFLSTLSCMYVGAVPYDLLVSTEIKDRLNQ